MKMKIKKSILGFIIFSLLPPVGIEAGAGKSFGLFGGGMAAGIIGTKMFSRDNRRREPVVVERVVEQRPVYVQQSAPVQQPAGQTQETQNLKSQIDTQDDRIKELERTNSELERTNSEVGRRLRKEHKEHQDANKNKMQAKGIARKRPKTIKRSDEDAFEEKIKERKGKASKKPQTLKQLHKDAFGDWDSEIEG